MEKRQLRQLALARRASLSGNEIQAKSTNIIKRLLGLPAYGQARTIFTYLSFQNEVATQRFISGAWLQQKRIVVPVCQPSDKSLLLSELHSFSELAAGTWNIPEPKREFQHPVNPLEIDLAVITGLAFDGRGYRLGYGAGYFDRFLPKLAPSCPIVALTYEFTLCETLPNEPHDIPVDYIITEDNTYKINP